MCRLGRIVSLGRRGARISIRRIGEFLKLRSKRPGRLAHKSENSLMKLGEGIVKRRRKARRKAWKNSSAARSPSLQAQLFAPWAISWGNSSQPQSLSGASLGGLLSIQYSSPSSISSGSKPPTGPPAPPPPAPGAPAPGVTGSQAGPRDRPPPRGSPKS